MCRSESARKEAIFLVPKGRRARTLRSTFFAGDDENSFRSLVRHANAGLVCAFGEQRTHHCYAVEADHQHCFCNCSNGPLSRSFLPLCEAHLSGEADAVRTENVALPVSLPRVSFGVRKNHV